MCRVLDYSKYKYEQAQKLKQARKHQQQITIREIKFRPKIAQHDYDTKKDHVERFLRHKDKVKVTIMFRGREVTHPERGTAILDRLAEELAELGVVEQRPMQDGRNMTMMMAPSKAVLAGQSRRRRRPPTRSSPNGRAAATSPRRRSSRERSAADVTPTRRAAPTVAERARCGGRRARRRRAPERCRGRADDAAGDAGRRARLPSTADASADSRACHNRSAAPCPR